MILALIAALLLGVLSGTLTGLFPGIHINLVGAMLLASIGGGIFVGVPAVALVVFVVAMAITHTFIDFIPSIFLGAPEEETYLSVLPGHQLLKEGRGYEAVVVTFYGALVALPLTLIFSFLFFYLLENVFNFVKTFIPYLLIFLSLYLIFREEEFLISLAVFILAGFLGLLTFNLPVKEPLFPLLSGLFGISGILISLKDKVKIPKQKFLPLRKIKLEKKYFLKASFASAICAPLFSFLPAVGSGYAAIFGSEIMGKEGRDNRVFLFLLGAINVIVMSLSFVTAFVIGKTRTGSAAVVQEILGKITLSDLFVIIFVIIISAVCAFFLGIKLARVFAILMSKVNYSLVSVIVIVIIFIISLILSNIYGIIVLITGTALGVFCILSKARRINLIGCLIIPTIVYYLV